jgi:hypothetical protein
VTAFGIGDGATFTAVELFTQQTYHWRGAVQTVRLDPEINPAAIFHITR